MAFSPSVAFAAECTSPVEGETEAQLQARLAACERDIQIQDGLVKAKQREATSLERDVAVLDARINKTKLEIKARDLSIKKLSGDISGKGKEITDLNLKIDRLQNAAAELLRRTHEIDEYSPVELLLSNENVSEFFGDLDTFQSVEGEVRSTVDTIFDVRAETQRQREELETKKERENNLKAVQQVEKQKTESLQQEKNSILKDTRGEEKKYKEVLAQKQKTLNEIRNKIVRFSDGGELKFPEALRIARIPEAALGIRAAFLLSVLSQESSVGGVIGKNIGRCFYNTPWDNPAGTVMSDSQKGSFLALIREIGRDPNTTPVSCPIDSDGAYGGAMGPAQFMPKTWWDIDSQTGYKRRVEGVTGHVPASPFNNTDAFTASALYLNDGLKYCKTIYNSQYDQERCAAARYYAGSNWRRFMNAYGKSVADRANGFQKDIDILDSSS